MYISSIALTFAYLINNNLKLRYLILAMITIAIYSHGFMLYTEIETKLGQNLTTLNMISFSSWILEIGIILYAIKKFTPVLLIFNSSLASILVTIDIWFTQEKVILQTIKTPFNLLHILIASFSMSMLTLMALQSILVIAHNYILKYCFSNRYLSKLKPIEETESSLFKLVYIGFILISVLIFSLYFMSFQINTQNILSILFGIIVWITLGYLLYLRKKFGLRGTKVNVSILACTIILLISFSCHQYLL